MMNATDGPDELAMLEERLLVAVTVVFRLMASMTLFLPVSEK